MLVLSSQQMLLHLPNSQTHIHLREREREVGVREIDREREKWRLDAALTEAVFGAG